MAMDKEREALVEVLTNHIADLRRCQERIEQSDYAEVFKATALEFGKAADELAPVLAALTAQQEPDQGADWYNRRTDSFDGWINELLTLANHREPIPSFARQAMRTIAIGLKKHHTAPPSGAQPADGVVVPVEPTKEMLLAMMKSDGSFIEPSPQVIEDGVVIEFGFSQEDADAINKEVMGDYRKTYAALLAAAKEPRKTAGMQHHPDDDAVDMFAAAMKAKLAVKRAQGRGGWDDPEQCSIDDLQRMLDEHYAREGQHIDCANFLMMIWFRKNFIDKEPRK